MSIGIYCIKNTVNGKVYVGQSGDIESRRSGHYSALRCGTHPNEHIQRAYVKYGQDAFEFRLLETCDTRMLDVRESAWIAYYNSMDPASGYNKESGGCADKTLSEETRKKMSVARKGYKHTAEARKNMSLARIGIKLSPEHCRRISEVKRGTKASEATKRLLSEQRRGRKLKPLSEETKRKISEAGRGRKRDPADVARRAALLRGKKRDPDIGRRVGEKQRGKVVSEETRAKMREAWKHRAPFTAEYKKRLSEAHLLRHQRKRAEALPYDIDATAEQLALTVGAQ